MARNAIVLILGVGWFAGCADSKPPGPPMAKVSGTVTLDGKPMSGGEVRFNLVGQPAQSLEIKAGAFSGEVFVGKHRVEVLWEKDGPPNPTDPKAPPIKVNVVSDRFSGTMSPFSFEIDGEGKSDLKLEVLFARK